jgi:hypothetical protein
LLADIQSNINNKINGPSTSRLFLYGAHDNQLLGLYKLLELNTDFVQPEYGSALIFELRQSVSNPSDYYMQTFLKNNNETQPIEPKLMKIAGLFL